MAIADDFTIAVTGAITHTANTNTYTVLELHRWLQDLADAESPPGNDLIDITSSTPSERATDNIITLNSPYYIDDDASEYFYDGSIAQTHPTLGDELYSGLEVVGSLFGTTTLQVVQSNALYDGAAPFWGTGLNVDAAANILSRFLVKTRTNGIDIDGKRIRVFAREWNETFAEFSVTMGLGISVAAIFTNDDLNNASLIGTIGAMTDIVNSGGTAAAPTGGYQLIDLGNGNGSQPYYSQWDEGANDQWDIYERAKWLTWRATTSTSVDGIDGELFRGITHQWDYDNETGALQEREIIAWGTSFDYVSGTGAFTIGEQVTFSPSGAKGTLLYDDGPTTGNMVVATDSGTITNADTMTGLTSTQTCDVGTTVTGAAASGGTALILADDGTDTLWVQLLTGVAPADPLFVFGRTSEFSNQVNGSVTSRSLSPVFFGASTGSAIIGAFGIGVQSADLATTDKLTDLLNALQVPPNNVTFYVYGLISGDRVLVTNDNSGIDFAQMSLGTTLNASGQVLIDVGTGNIPADTPQTGVLRVELDTGVYRYIEYTSHDSDDGFTTASTDWTDPLDATAANNVFLGYIDKATATTQESFTVVYNAPRTLFVRVRDGGASPIKTFESTGTLGTAGGSTTAIRTSDE